MNIDSPMGMNLHTIASFGSGWAFVDAWKHAREWISQQEGEPWGEGGPLDVDENGWVRSLIPGQSADNVIMDVHGVYPAGHYTVLYQGEGTMIWSGDAIPVVEEPGRIILDFTPSTRGIWVKISSTDPTNHLRNIRVIMPGFERTYEREPFHPRFLKLWGEYRVLRFMNWLRTNNSSVRSWTERTTPASSHQMRGVAFEHIIALCNRLQADAWINIPHQADDDYVTRCATLFGETLDPPLKLHVEYSNEVWNGAPAFIEQFNYAADQGLALGLLSPDELGSNPDVLGLSPDEQEHVARLRYYARRSVEIFRLFETIFGGTDRLVRVLAWQSARVDDAYKMLSWENAYEHADAFAIAPYIGATLDALITEAGIAELTVDEVLDRVEAEIPFLMVDVRQHAEHAAALGLDLIAYEGGQHLVAQQSETLREKFFDANRHPRMREIYLEYFTSWKLAGGKTFCYFDQMGQYGQSGSWGLLEHYAQFPFEVPKFCGANQFNEVAGRWWVGPTPAPLPQAPVLVDFDATSLAADGRLNRPLEEIRMEDTLTGSRIPFSTAAGDYLFDVGDYRQGRFYGGYQADFAPHAQPEIPYLQLRSNDEGYAPNRFHIRIGSEGDRPSAQTALFLWLSEDFLTGRPPFSLGKLSLELGDVSPEHAELRFVVRNGADYYLSDYVAGTPGVHELMDLTQSALPGHRWAKFNPAATAFGIPEILVQFAPMVFNDVAAVGFIYVGRRRGYHHNFQFIRFSAQAALREELTATIARAPRQQWLTNEEAIGFDVVFSAPVVGFVAEAVSLRGNALPTTVSVGEVGPHDGTTYRVEVGGMSREGSVIVEIPAGAVSCDGIPNRPATSLDNYVYFTGGEHGMDEPDQVLGIVRSGELQILRPTRLAGQSVRLTTNAMQVSAPPETEEVDLRECEGQSILARGQVSSGWLCAAEILDEGGPIVTALVERALLDDDS